MLEWSEPSPTIVAHLAKDANSYVLPDYYEHARPIPDRSDPERNRGITPREAARLQSFPDDYIFLGLLPAGSNRSETRYHLLQGNELAMWFTLLLDQKRLLRLIQTYQGLGKPFPMTKPN